MPSVNPYALYVNCDGAMDYDSVNSGGVGFRISFPDYTDIPPILISIGTYIGGNIEQLELEAITQAMKEVITVVGQYQAELRRVTSIIFITDRFGLRQEDKTSPYRIAQWRKNKWKTHEGKPIKNHKQLDELDKTRLKLSKLAKARIEIQWRPRKENRGADKLAKAGKHGGEVIEKLAKKGEKIGWKLFKGPEIKYNVLKAESELTIRVFRKDPVQDEWEVWAELCEGEYVGNRIKLYADNVLAAKLQRQNTYVVRIKEVLRHFIRIYRTLRKTTTPSIETPEEKELGDYWLKKKSLGPR